VFDLSIGKLLVIAVVALFLVGPEKLPVYAAQLGKWVRVARSMTDEAKHRIAKEMGPEFGDVDWAELDPRRYHPKRLLADAWNATDDRPGRSSPEPERVYEPDALDRAEERAVAEAKAAAVPVPIPVHD
jgi:sec-independent protein translocase protein TatB